MPAFFLKKIIEEFHRNSSKKTSIGFPGCFSDSGKGEVVIACFLCGFELYSEPKIFDIFAITFMDLISELKEFLIQYLI